MNSPEDYANAVVALRDGCVDRASGQVDFGALIKFVTAVICHSDPGRDISGLKSVRSSSNYRQLLVQLANELGRPVVATERTSGRGFAMLVPDAGGAFSPWTLRSYIA